MFPNTNLSLLFWFRIAYKEKLPLFNAVYVCEIQKKSSILTLIKLTISPCVMFRISLPLTATTRSPTLNFPDLDAGEFSRI